MKAKGKKILGGLVAAGLVGLAIMLYLYNKPHQDIAGTKAAYSLQAADLATEYNENEVRANEKYLGEILLVEGTITALASSRDSSISYSLLDPVSGVTCTINSDDVEKYADQLDDLREGSTARFKGRCDGRLTDVRISDCVPVY